VGLASEGEVVEILSFVDKGGGIGFRFRSGVVMGYSPYSRTSDQYVADVLDAIAAGDWPGFTVPVRGTLAMAIDKNSNGPAALSWSEGGVLISMSGRGGQSLADLIQVAESMREV
jgi:hypothetical protein